MVTVPLLRPLALLGLALALLLASASAARAQETAPPAAPAPAASDQEPARSCPVTIDAGVDFVTEYFFRGINQEDHGLIIQPYLELGVPLYQGDGAISSLALNVGVFNSVHSEETGTDSDSDLDAWYEADVYGGVSLSWFKKFETSLTFHAYTSPNDAFDVVQELDLAISYDDSNCWQWLSLPGFRGLQPSVTVAFETNRSRFGTHSGNYLEVAMGPSFTLIQSQRHPVTLSVPLTWGFSLDDYYEDAVGDDDGFGYFDVGLIAEMALGCISSDDLRWSVHAGVHFLFLGSDNLEAANSGDDFETIGIIGLALNY